MPPITYSATDHQGNPQRRCCTAIPSNTICRAAGQEAGRLARKRGGPGGPHGLRGRMCRRVDAAIRCDFDPSRLLLVRGAIPLDKGRSPNSPVRGFLLHSPSRKGGLGTHEAGADIGSSRASRAADRGHMPLILAPDRSKLSKRPGP